MSLTTLSFLEAVLAALGLDPLSEGLALLDALKPKPPSGTPSLFCRVSNRSIASSLRSALLALYPEDHPIAVVTAADSAGPPQVQELPLSALGRKGRFDHLTCVYVPALAPEQNLRSFEGIRHIVARLRGPDGCPWDREQTHESIKGYMLEESYEALEALDTGKLRQFCEELGDLLMQVMLQAQIAEDNGEFDIHDVIEAIATKLIRRHPHVFGDLKVSGSHEVLLNWEALKREEREEGASILSSVPKLLPALAQAQAVQDRAARVGFDWERLDQVWEKFEEELGEMKRAQTAPERLRELGDLLFVLVNMSRWLKLDAEEALRLANERFRRRFTYIEERCRESGQPLESLSLAELNTLWDEAKASLSSE